MKFISVDSEIEYQLSLDNWSSAPCLQIVMSPTPGKDIQDFESFLQKDKATRHLEGISQPCLGENNGKTVLCFHEETPPLGMIYYSHHERFWFVAYPRQIERIFGAKHYGNPDLFQKRGVHCFLQGVLRFLKRMANNKLITGAVIEDEVNTFPGDWKRDFENGVIFYNWLPNDFAQNEQKKCTQGFSFLLFEHC